VLVLFVADGYQSCMVINVLTHDIGMHLLLVD